MVWIIAALTTLVAVTTILPALPIAHGFVRVCDFPRLQIALLAALLLPVTLVFGPGGWAQWLMLGVQLAVVVRQGLICLRYTPLWRNQSIAVDGPPPEGSDVRIVTCNVKMSNRRYDQLAETISRADPDIAIFLEVDAGWCEALRTLAKDRPHVVQRPQDNSFGILVLSRLELDEVDVRFRLLPDVPSVNAAVRLVDGRRFRLHVLHPEPPVPYADTIGRDAELVLTAEEINADTLPAVVTGDLNDVAWSRTTHRFQRLTGLLDPRVGRGFYNSFHADYPFFRWPLDHLFHDAQFRLVRLDRLDHVGSDHFPMLFEVSLAHEKKAAEEPGAANGNDIEEARQLQSVAKRLDRETIGADWEK